MLQIQSVFRNEQKLALTRKTAVSKSCANQLLYLALFLHSDIRSRYDGI